MENQLQKFNQLRTIEYSDAHSFLVKMHREFKAFAVEMAKNHALISKPEESGGKLLIYLEPLWAKYNSVIPQYRRLCKAHLARQYGTLDLQTGTKENKSLSRSLNEAEKDRDTFLDTIEPAPRSYFTLFIFFIGMLLSTIIFIGDISFLSSTLQRITSNYGSSLVLSISIAFSILVVSHLSPILISKIQSLRKRQLATVLVFLFVLLLFTALAMLRAQYIEITGHSSVPAWFFVLINSFVFFALYILAVLTLVPVIPQLKDIFKRMRSNVELKKHNKKVEKLNTEIKNNGVKVATALRGHMETIYDEAQLDIEANRMYHESVSEYKRLIIELLPYTPNCLDQKPAPLNFEQPDTTNSTTE